MSGYLCTFLDSCYSFPSIPYHIPSKPFRILTPIHLSYNPLPTRRIIRRSRRRRRRNSLQLSVLSQDFDLIETSEHHDGSLIFRFGDPSEIAKSDASVEDEEGSDAVKVVDGDHEEEVIVETIVGEKRSGGAISSSTDVSGSISKLDNDITVVERESDVEKELSSQVESSQSDDLVEDLESEGEEGSNVSKVLDEDQVIAKTVERQERSDTGSSNSTDVSDSISKVDTDITAVEMECYVEKDISDSQVESSERSLEISQEGEVSLPVPVSVSDFQMNDLLISDLGLTDVDKGKCSDEKDEDAISSSVTNTVADDSFSVKGIDDSEEEVTMFESPSFKLNLTIEDPNIEVMQLSLDVEYQKVEAGLQTELAVNEADKDITVIEIETDVVGDLSDSQPELNERTLEISHEVEVSDSGLQTEAADSINIAETDINLVETESNVVGDLNDSQSELSERPLEISQEVEVPVSGLQTEVTDSINKAEKDITVIRTESDLVGDLSDSQPELSERLLEICQEVEVPVSVSEIITNDHFHTVSSLENAVDDEDHLNEKDEDGSPMSSTVTDNSLHVENSGDTEEVTTEDSGDVTVVQSPSVGLDDLVLKDPSIEAVNSSVDAKDENILAESQLVDMKDSGEIHTKEVTPLSRALQAEPVLDDGVSLDALEESAEADSIESPTMLNQDVTNSLVEAERTEGKKQSSEVSEVSRVEVIQLELTETDVKREESSTATFFLSSGAAVLAHPSKVERMHTFWLAVTGSELPMVSVSGHLKVLIQGFMPTSS